MSDGLVLTQTYFFHMAHILPWNDSDEPVCIWPPDTATSQHLLEQQTYSQATVGPKFKCHTSIRHGRWHLGYFCPRI